MGRNILFHFATLTLVLSALLCCEYLGFNRPSTKSKMLQCAPAARNKHHILAVLKDTIESPPTSRTGTIRILEIASGTGEHAALFSSELSNVLYQPSDPDADKMESIKAWTENSPHVLQPINFDVQSMLNDELLLGGILSEDGKVDVIICINMVHISPISSTIDLFKLAGKYLKRGGILYLYGPYRVGGYMTDSNINFDKSLQDRNPQWGVRDLEAIEELAAHHGGLVLIKTVEMPANNLSVLFSNN